MIEKLVDDGLGGSVEERGEEEAGEAGGADVGEEEGEGGAVHGVDGGVGEGAVGAEFWDDWL